VIYTSPQGHNRPGSSVGDELRHLQQLHVGLAVERSQCHVAAAKLQLAERRVDDLPVQREGLTGGYTANQVEQGGDGATGGEHRDVVATAGSVQHPLQAGVDPCGERLPGLQAVVLMFAGVPALHHQGEQTLELATVLHAIAQDVPGVRLIGHQARQQGADNAVGIELVERRVGLEGRDGMAITFQGFQREPGGVLLAPQVTRHTAVQAQAKLSQVFAQRLALPDAHGGQHVIVVGTKGGLAMSDQVEVAHEVVRPLEG